MRLTCNLRRSLFRPADLQLDHSAVSAAAEHQFIVPAALGDSAVFDHQDLVGVADRAEAVGDDEAGAAGHQRGQRLLDEPFVFRVEVAGGFVEDQDVGIGEHGAGDGDALALAAGEAQAALADRRVVSLGQF